MKNIVIETNDLKKEFLVGENITEVLSGINLKIYSEDFAIIYGPSGCGKTTLLNIITGLEEPTQGNVIIRGTNIYKMTEDERAEFRAEKFGIVYQQSYWIKSLNVIDNVSLPLVIDGYSHSSAITRAKNVLEEIGMVKFANHLPTQLSGGQQQKASVARALVSNPWILVADEPTGNLDHNAGIELMEMFETLNSKSKRTIVLVTHNTEYLKQYGNNKISMLDGKIV